MFGLAIQLTGSYRISALSLALFFLGGLAVLARVDVARAVAEASETPAGGE
jgi:MFS transporter, UMF1 family